MKGRLTAGGRWTRLCILSAIWLTSTWCQAQISYEGKARNRIQKGKWMQAQQALQKALRKDSLNPEARHLYSVFYFSPGNPRYNIDSAYSFSLSALTAYGQSPLRQRERMKRIPLDSILITRHRQRIDSAAFERAKSSSTEKAYQFFIDHFRTASQLSAAIELRDEEAFLEALKINTYGAFAAYVARYPASHRAKEARDRYEKLLYEDKTRDGRQKSYEQFLQDYPETPYRALAEKNIFEISTADGSTESYRAFLFRYPQSSLRKKCTDILYHLLKDAESILAKDLESDSLKSLADLEKGYWVPVLKNGKYGFMDQKGVEVIPPRFESLSEDYLCGDIRTDFLITSEGVISRSGKKIFDHEAESVSDLGLGFLKIQSGDCVSVIHKSGLLVGMPCLLEVRIIGRRFLAFNAGGKWGITAFNGRELLAAQFEDIYSIGEVIVFKKSGKKSIKTISQVAQVADQVPLAESEVFDEVRELDAGRYLVWNGALAGLLNARLEYLVPLDRHTLTKTPFGYVTEKGGKITISGIDELQDISFDRYKFYENWLQLRDDKGIHLFNVSSKRMVQSGVDSVWFLNHVAFVNKNDSLHVLLKSGMDRVFPEQTNIQFIKGPDSVAHFFTSEKTKKSVYDLISGSRIFQADFDEIEFLGHQVFVIGRDGRKGLLNDEGKSILPVEYHLIVATHRDFVSLFKDRKFGLFDLKKRRLIKTAYERNVIPFRENVFIAFKDGYYGFIHPDGKPLGKFEFDEVQEWSDSVALVKKNFQWQLHEVYAGKTGLDRIKDFRPVMNSSTEKVFIFHRENAYGVISTVKGVIIPATFSDIVNVGSDEEPLYFTEKNVEEAGIYVVIYYDKKGRLLRRQVFEKEEYERIYCDE